jgi:hypothetical protein
VRRPPNFKPSGTKAGGGDSYMMVNYLPVYLLALARVRALGLPLGSVCSWSELCWMFTNNFRATYARPGVDWNLANMIQKKGESLQEFIQCSCNNRNVTSEVNDKSIIIFFKKGLRDSSLILKLTMKNSSTSEEMLAIANKYALAEEVTLDSRERKKAKESGHSDEPSSSKGHDMESKADRSVNNIERS